MAPRTRLKLIRDGCLAALVFVAVLEVCIHVDERVRWGSPVIAPYSEDGLRFVDGKGFRNRPGASFQKWTINEHGFRGPAVPLQKAPGVSRVVVMGASEAFGMFEEAGAEFPAQLAELLDQGDRGPVEVINAAVAGSGLPNQRQLYVEWVSQFSPDYVIIYPSPSFYLTDEIPEIAPVAAALPAEPRWAFRLPSRAKSRIRGFIPPSLIGWKNRILVERAVEGRPAGWRWTKVPEDRLALFMRDLLALVEVAERSGAQVVLSTHANKFDRSEPNFRDPDFAGWWRYFPRADSVALIETVLEANREIRKAGEQRGLTVVDVEAMIGGDPSNFADANHFSEAGAARVAAAFARALDGMIEKGRADSLVASIR